MNMLKKINRTVSYNGVPYLLTLSTPNGPGRSVVAEIAPNALYMNDDQFHLISKMPWRTAFFKNLKTAAIWLDMVEGDFENLLGFKEIISIQICVLDPTNIRKTSCKYETIDPLSVLAIASKMEEDMTNYMNKLS